MKKFSSFIAGLLSLTMLFSVNVFATEKVENEKTDGFVSPFKDVSEDTKNYKEIVKMYEAGYIKGYGDDNFKPDGNITRAELVVILNKLFMFDEETDYTKKFTDVAEANWFYEPVMKAGAVGYIAGFPDGSFKPNDNFTRQQFCVVLSQINNFEKLEFDKEVKDAISPWASDYVYKVLSNRVMLLESGDTFRATENITRSEVCAALAGFIVESEDIQTTEKSEETTEVTTASQTTTVTTSSSGGGGGGSSKKNNTTTTTTETTTNKTITESTTETTTNKTIVESTTEATTKNITFSSEEKEKLISVIDGLRTATSAFSTENEKTLANFIIASMSAKAEDNSYDFTDDMETAKEMYKSLSEDEKDDFKLNVQIYIPINNLIYFAELLGLM